MFLAALVLMQSMSFIAGDENVRPAARGFPYTSNAGVDLGCIGVGLEGSRYPARIYDAQHNERVIYNVSRCSGGYVQATNEATGKSWDINFGPSGQVRGRDLDGAKWRFDKSRDVYVNLKTQAECAKPDYRRMCASPGA
jgi:hypothetical protein